MNRFFRLGVLFAISGISIQAYSQNNNADDKFNDLGLNRAITTSVPFLTLAPDARSGALGDAGVATSPDAYSAHWNAAKLAFQEKDLGISVSYNPWLRKLVGDMALSYITAYKKLSKQEAIGFHLTYFDLGSIQFTDDFGNPLQEFEPKEFSTGLNYSRKLSENFGVAIGLKFIHSNLSGNLNLNGLQTKPGNSAAGDVGVYYRKDYMIGGKNTNIALGANISNLGAKISYSNSEQKNFIPTNLRVGTAITAELDPFNKITFIVDANKLMVPTPPNYVQNRYGQDSTDSDGNRILSDDGSQDPNRPLLSGVLGSFSDAPGGFSEELKEIMLSFGLEYWYHDGRGNPLFAVRGGYFHENRMKGNRKYFTAGFGLRYQMFGVDFAYLIPTQQNNPLAESLRISLQLNFDTRRVEESITE